MNSSLHNQLIQLQDKLSILDKTVDNISNTANISTYTAKTTTKKQEEYASELRQIQNSLDKPQTPENLKSHIELFNHESGAVLNQYDTQLIEMENLLKSYQPLVSQTQGLLQTINQIDFPKRLNKLDTSINNINKGVKNVNNDVNELLANIEDENKNANLIKIFLLLSAFLVGGIILLLMNVTTL